MSKTESIEWIANFLKSKDDEQVEYIRYLIAYYFGEEPPENV